MCTKRGREEGGNCGEGTTNKEVRDSVTIRRANGKTVYGEEEGGGNRDLGQGREKASG